MLLRGTQLVVTLKRVNFLTIGIDSDPWIPIVCGTKGSEIVTCTRAPVTPECD